MSSQFPVLSSQFPDQVQLSAVSFQPISRLSSRAEREIREAEFTRSRGTLCFALLLLMTSGLKPASLLALGGTAEAVPFPKPIYEKASRNYETSN
jgi:hypothetical protein